MLRPLLAVGALALAVFVLAPTVQSVHEGVERLEIRREFPWQIWKWGEKIEPPQTLVPPNCDYQNKDLYSEVTQWPQRIRKNETFELGGIVAVGDAKGPGVEGVTVDLFLNETKEEPGEFLGRVTTNGAGRFTLQTTVPFELQATRYHLVAHALEKMHGCVRYREHWSDPEMEVTSKTTIEWDPTPVAIVGRETTLSGRLLDSVGAPVRNAKVVVEVNDEDRELATDGDGRFATSYKPTWAGNHTIVARFAATQYYGEARAERKLPVHDEFVQLDGADGPDGVEIVRGTPTTLTGTVYLSGNRTPKEIRIAFDGVRVASCETCPAASNLTARPAADGTFSLPVYVASTEEAGPFTMRIEGGGLRNPQTYEGAVFVPVSVALRADATGFFAKSFEGTAAATDEAGRPVEGDVALWALDQWLATTPGGAGRTFSYESGCGEHRLRAVYNGTAWHRPASAETDVRVCPYMAFVPPFLLAIPWWGWLVLATGIVAAWIAYRRLREAYATVITRGPPLTLTFTEPRDAAAGIAAPGERAVATAFLEDPLPDGHTLRVGTHRRTEAIGIGPDLRASIEVEAAKLGELPVRAEIVDARGRVVSRRTAKLRVVRYAEEIESRHLRLRRETLGEKAERASPREFEAWLAARAPDLDRDVARRLVAIFEEADYGPREAGRAELVAYMQAESDAEVASRALLP